jgi:uncharacterized protein YkwD
VKPALVRLLEWQIDESRGFGKFSMYTKILVTVALCTSVVAAACGKNPVGSTPTGSSGTSSEGGSGLPRPTTADLVFCVDETNRYRAMRNRPALSRSTTLEAFATDGACNDGLANVPHQHVSTTQCREAGCGLRMKWCAGPIT